MDDEPLNLKLLERRLSQVGFSVLAATGGVEALELLGQKEIDAVLLDVKMPEMDGAEVLRAIRANEQWRALPVLMLSADDKQETVERCYQLGANDYLVKPYNLNDLHLRLAVSMEMARAKKAKCN